MVPEEGSVSTDGVTVRTSFYRKWDQDRLTQLSEAIDPAYWPFKVEWKEDRKASRVRSASPSCGGTLPTPSP